MTSLQKLEKLIEMHLPFKFEYSGYGEIIWTFNDQYGFSLSVEEAISDLYNRVTVIYPEKFK